jgi:putative MATE family efflux protein
MSEPLELGAGARAPETNPQGAGAGRGFLGTLRDALTGSEHQDFTEGSIPRAIFVLAVPMVLEMLMESLFGIVNAFWVSRLGKDALAAVGLTESMLTIIFGIALGVAMATTATVARRVGERDHEAAAQAAAQAIMLGVVVSVALGAVGFAFAPDLLRLMGAEAGAVATGASYPRIIFGTNVVIVLLFLNNAVFRGAGDAALAMRALWLGNLINLVLDPLLIFGVGPFPEMGVTGSAVATTIGRGAGVLYQFQLLGSGASRVRLRREHLRPDFAAMWKLARISLGGTFQYLVATASWVVIVRVVAYSGSAAVAGYTVAVRILIVALLPSWGMSNAAATLVGQNLGAGRPERAERSVWLTGLANMAFLAAVTVVTLLFAGRMIRLFTGEPEVVSYGVDCLRYVAYGYVFYAWGMVLVQSFNGAGDTWTPTVINIACFWVLEIPLAYALALLAGMGAQGVFLAITIAESLLAVVGFFAFRRGRWKAKQV